MTDEDEVLEVVEVGGAVHEVPVGLEHAKARAHGRFLDGQITVEEYEAEVERLLRKEAR